MNRIWLGKCLYCRNFTSYAQFHCHRINLDEHLHDYLLLSMSLPTNVISLLEYAHRTWITSSSSFFYFLSMSKWRKRARTPNAIGISLREKTMRINTQNTPRYVLKVLFATKPVEWKATVVFRSIYSIIFWRRTSVNEKSKKATVIQIATNILCNAWWWFAAPPNETQPGKKMSSLAVKKRIWIIKTTEFKYKMHFYGFSAFKNCFITFICIAW